MYLISVTSFNISMFLKVHNIIILLGFIFVFWASLVTQMVNNLPVMQKNWVQSLGQEDLLEKEIATHSSIVAWEIPWSEEPGGLQSMGSKESNMT